MVEAEVLEGDVVQWHAHEVGIDAAQNGDVTHDHDRAALTFELCCSVD